MPPLKAGANSSAVRRGGGAATSPLPSQLWEGVWGPDGAQRGGRALTPKCRADSSLPPTLPSSH